MDDAAIDQLVEQIRVFDGKQFSYVRIDEAGVNGRLIVDWTFTQTQLRQIIRDAIARIS